MSTRGSLTVKGKTHYIRSDAYPEFAQKILSKAAKSKNPVETANRLAREQGYRDDWVDKKPYDKSEAGGWIGDTLFNEHQYRIVGKKALHAKTIYRGDPKYPVEKSMEKFTYRATPMGRFSRRR
jgi:hypothetical protein